MSTLLHRLAGQAIGASAPRVRAAERARAHVPIVMPAVPPPRMTDAPLIPTTDRTSPPVEHDRDGEADAAPRWLDLRVPPMTVPERAAPRLVTSPDAPGRAIADLPPPVAPMPAPLLGTVQHTVPVEMTVGSIQPAARRASSPVSGREPAEVHVHIGRIEVAAVSSPPPPRKRDASPRRALALSDYLAKRRSS